MLDDVIGVTLCDFEMWPGAEVPMLSRWRMQEQHGAARGLSQLQFVFLELPKLDVSREPRTLVEKWAYFFREASNVSVIPPAVSAPPISDAFEAARTAGFTEDEWDAYIRAGMAIQDERGALSLAARLGKAEGRREGEAAGRREGEAAGRREGLATAIETVCDVLGIDLGPERRAELAGLDAAALGARLERIRRERRWS